ncbi:MAG: IS630 family transposase [Planctomycetes bacterium]|nr:IS630 family transposase [Planctomycetota bacterium]
MGKEAKYIVRLTMEERGTLESLVAEGRAAANKLLRARMLLKANVGQSGPGWTDEKIAEAFEVGPSTVHRLRQRLVEDGFEATLVRKPKVRHRAPKLDGEKEARLVALACSGPPEGRARWTLQLLADKLVELDVVDSITAETVRGAAKKNEIKPWRRRQWVIPPEQNADFVCAMEDVLEVYHRPYDPQRPVVCFDEASKQLIKETRVPIAAAPGRPETTDYEYERNGTANLFMMFEPLVGQRHVKVTERRTALDYAHVIRELVDVHYATVEKVVLVQDNLNTHKPASLYEAFPPEEARRIVDKLEIHYTPKHGSWLNMAETELGILSRQCLDRRLEDRQILTSEVAAWETNRNNLQCKVHWQFTTADARTKLWRLYPVIEPVNFNLKDH